MKQDDGWLVALWLLISGLIGVLSYINPTHYLSPDSTYYLSFAGWLVGLDGDKYVHVSPGWEGTFPVGYPLLIGTLANLTGMSLLMASKALNVLLTGIFLFIWRQRIGPRQTIWVGSLLLLGGFLRILAYTWSEWAFLILLIEWMWFLSRSEASEQTTAAHYRYVAKLLLFTVGLFLLRYVGGYVVIVYSLMSLGTYWRGGWSVFRQRIWPDLLYVGISMAFMLAYFFLNSQLSSSPFGGERFVDSAETQVDKLIVIARASVNELLLFRDYVPGEPSLLVFIGLLVQIALFWWLWPEMKQKKDTLPDLSLTDRQALNVAILSAITYLAILFTMRLLSPFNGPNARLMAPAIVPALVLLARWISRWTNVAARRQLGYWWTVVLLCSWLQVLPQIDLWAKLTQLYPGK